MVVLDVSLRPNNIFVTQEGESAVVAEIQIRIYFWRETYINFFFLI